MKVLGYIFLVVIGTLLVFGIAEFIFLVTTVSLGVVTIILGVCAILGLIGAIFKT